MKVYLKRKRRMKWVGTLDMCVDCIYYFLEVNLLIGFALPSGEFADVLGEDYLGLRALVIAAEFGLSNLSIPKKLLKEKKGQNTPTMLVFFLFLISHDIYVVTAFHSAKPSELPPSYPPPVPFVLLRASNINNQIGLLKPYYYNWIALLVASSAPPIAVAPAPLPGPALGPSLTSLNPSVPPPLPSHTILPGTHSNISNPLANPPALATPPPDLILPDNSQLKMTPIGQIVKSSGAGGGMKKKSKVVADESTGGNVVAGAAAAAGSSVLPVVVGMSGMYLADSGAQKKGAMGVGTENGWKKNTPLLLLPPVPMAIR
jgi:transcriptional activator SPT7